MENSFSLCPIPTAPMASVKEKLPQLTCVWCTLISLKPTAVNKASKTLSVSLAEENEGNDVVEIERFEKEEKTEEVKTEIVENIVGGMGVPNSINVVHEIEPNNDFLNESEKMDEPKLEEKAEKKSKKDKQQSGELF